MAANVGSMFQYWKRFDLRRLQVSAGSAGRAAVGSPRARPGRIGEVPGRVGGRPGAAGGGCWGSLGLGCPLPIDRY